MNTASPAAPAIFAPPTLREKVFYFWSAVFVIGNPALPQLSHLVAPASPLLNHALFGMPPACAPSRYRRSLT
jgi:hypothetical protein